MWHKPCRTFHPWCPCIKTRCLFIFVLISLFIYFYFYGFKFFATAPVDALVPYVGPFISRSSATTIQWRHNGRDSVSNHQPHDCLLNRLSRRRSKKTSKLRVTDLCAGIGEFPAQMASYAENASIWWLHHAWYWNDVGQISLLRSNWK